MDGLYSGRSLTQCYSSVVGRYQMVDQNSEALCFQTSFDQVQKKTVLKAASAEGGGLYPFFFADPNAGRNDLAGEHFVKSPCEAVRIFSLKSSESDPFYDLVCRKDPVSLCSFYYILIRCALLISASEHGFLIPLRG